MQRFLASALVALFSFMLIAPVASAGDDDAATPACCRRGGAHNCVLVRLKAERLGAAKSERVTGASVSARASQCPYALGTAVLSSTAAAVLPPRKVSVSRSIFRKENRQAQTEARFRVSFSRSRQKRGPPSSS